LAYTNHPLFQELAPAANIAVDKFTREFKDFKVPTQAFMLAGLAARVKDSRPTPAKRSITPSFTCHAFHKALCLATAAASDSPTGPRADKVKKSKNSVRLLLCPIVSYF
jgi:hypothetical protein